MRGDTRVDLSPRLVEILGYLAARPGETIPKDVLLDRFWQDVHVTENTVDRAMTRIRKAVEENPAQPRFIQTVARRGYRFIGPVDNGGGPPQADALELWMKGRGSLEALDAEQLQDATAMFERLLASHPNYASAHAAIANAYFLLDPSRAARWSRPFTRTFRRHRVSIDDLLGERDRVVSR